MQTVSSLAERLDMNPDEALNKLNYMLFEVKNVDEILSDEACDVLIDIDDDPDLVERIRTKKLDAIEAEKKKAEATTKKRKAAAAKAAAKRKAEAKKAAPKKKATAKKKAAAKIETTVKQDETVADAEAETEAKTPSAALATGEEPPVGDAVARPAETAEDARMMEDSASADEVMSQEVAEVKQVVAPLAEILPDLPDPSAEPEQASQPSSPLSIPDPDVVAEVIRRDQERKRALKSEELVTSADPSKGPVAGPIADGDRPARGKEKTRKTGDEDGFSRANAAKRAQKKAEKPAIDPLSLDDAPARPVVVRKRSTGKTARKRQKKMERQRMEDQLRRDAAAAVREFQAQSPQGVGAKRRKYRRKEETGEEIEMGPIILEMENTMTVEELATAMEVSVNEIILELMEHDILATKNEALDIELVKKLAEPQGFDVQTIIPEEVEALREEEDDPADLVFRSPVVTVMGHVDHGKTTFLDRVRSANVAAGEAGGITQHIAAYDVPVGDGRVVFLDTPGHQAFTKMRARGAQCTDIVVLVVAADDGVMPQTIEAIDHAKAAGVPIVVAVNKCDKPGANPDRIRQELVNYGLQDDQWGGSTVMRNISALKNEGITELMELLVLETELLELKANPNKPARGTIIESELTRGQGPVAWVLVQSGTLRVGDAFIAGETYGRVRSMHNSRHEAMTEAGPAVPVVVTGFSAPPQAGDTFNIVRDDRQARSIAEKRMELNKQKAGHVVRPITLEDFHARMLAGEQKELNIIVKADVQGSVDVLESSLGKIGNDEVRTMVVHSGVGAVTESDILLASASSAVIMAFQVTAPAKVQKMAEAEGIEIKSYNVIYEAIDQVHLALEGMLTPDQKEVVTGHAEIRAVFRSSALGNIAGCYVTDGEFVRNCSARIVRDGKVVYTGEVSGLRREKDDVKSVSSGYECGIKLQRFEDIKEGDVIEAFRMESVAKKLPV